ncbi:MAG TPA: hypothetical protein VF352_02580 [Anaerolineales bacterium]
MDPNAVMTGGKVFICKRLEVRSMNSNSKFSNDLPAPAAGRHLVRSPLARWRRVFLALAITVASAGQTPPAQAAPAQETAKVYMDIVNPKTTVCVGKEVSYQARVYTAPTTIPAGINVDAYALPGIKVDAFSQDTSVGDFERTTKGNRTVITGSSEELLDDEPMPHTAYFTFKAKKAGITTLYFEGLAHGEYVSFNVPVKVINCKYKVKIVSKWSTGMTIVATMNGELKSDEQGYFTGSATVNWVTSKLCGIVSPIAPSTADLTGTINASGQLVVKITFGPMSSSGGGNCGGAGVTTTNSGNLDPLTVTVAGSRGEVFNKVLSSNWKNGSFPGSAVITVIPLPQ